MVNTFSTDVKEKLGYYVYRLVDPRNGITFYVGKGCGDRIFHHVNAVDMSFYDNKNVTNENDIITDENNDPAKIKRIVEIKSHGFDIIHIIQRFGMNEKTAYEVEAAFIDFFGLQNLTNKTQGHEMDRGMRSCEEIEREFTAEIFDDYPNCPKFILIKIKDYWINHNGGLTPDGIYKTVRFKWKLNPDRANKYPYVLAVRYGIVVGVYELTNGGWKQCSDDKEKAYFDGREAPTEIKNLFLNKRIPARFRKRQNPATYC